jgi:tripartite ATP-independent transporter DctM subunit
VGALFAAGVFPGLLMGGVFIAYIAIKCFFQKEIGPSIPADERASWSEKFQALRSVVLPVLLIFIVLGAIFFGVATPTEAAAIGALGSLICAAISGSLTWTIFKESSYETLKLSCMVVWIIIGGSCFAALYTAIGAVEFIKEVINALPVSKYLILFGIQLSFLILGMLMDPGAIIMICTPVFVPLIKSLGFDPVWFGILFIMNMEMGYLTPPFGFNLFYMKAIVPAGVGMTDIYKAIIPFVLLQALCLLIIIVFPQIALWLPRLIIN